VVGAATFTDPAGDGNLTDGASGTGTINYFTMALTLAGAPATTEIFVTFSYFPGLPVMGLRSLETASTVLQPTIAFDTVYAYNWNVTAWQEWIPGTTWTGTDSNFFWTTNYWVNGSNVKLFWVTNFSGPTGDPIRYTDGTTWTDFAPPLALGMTPVRLQQCLALLPYRGFFVAFNTYEGTSLAGSTHYPQRIRWSAIGNPIPNSDPTMLPQPWQDTPGNGGFLNIPTNESITAVGFVRDNCVVYCERSTWQLRYTQNSVAPFVIERVNSELGTGSLFSAVQFDTSLVGIGDKGVVECDSFQSVRIDPQIPDLVFSFNQMNQGNTRIQGVRDFIRKLAFWTYPYVPAEDAYNGTYPNYRLVYNYDNKSWATFTDSYTALGTFQPLTSETWEDVQAPWQAQNYPWIQRESLLLDIIGGNQEGYVEYLDQQVINDPSLTISAITSDNVNPTTLTVYNHNLSEGQIIQISDIPAMTGYAELNGGIFSVVPTGVNTLQLFVYNPVTDSFDIPQTDASQTFSGYGQIAIRDNFLIQSKKFNFMDEGQNVQLGHIDILMNTTSAGAISLYLFLDYNDNAPINILSQNQNSDTNKPDTFFNSILPTYQNGGIESDKCWHRIFCPVRGAFLTVVWTLSNLQMIGVEQESDVQIDAQILWLRKGGRLQNINI
jgi:hypothetical protein